MFKGMRKSVTERANEEIGNAKQAAQRKDYQTAVEFTEKALNLLEEENNRKQLDMVKALLNEYQGMNAIKFNKALEAANYLGRSGGFYHRLGMMAEHQRVFEQQAKILRVVAGQYMKDKKFVEAASYFERAAIAYQKFEKKADELDCKAKSYISRAAAEKNISGRKLYLKKAVELMEEKGSDEPVIRAHLAYYNALFVEDERPDLALKHYTEALQNYQLAGTQSRIEEIKAKIQKLTELV
ncbi:MAG: hypothetical protein GOP50_05985 [Candidatus Heimdallarchaeota archaeon]|nr:hypothetical protein [Candidatus Heimdallarchaeota archaeon]